VSFFVLQKSKEGSGSYKLRFAHFIYISPLPVHDLPSALLHKKRPGTQTCQRSKLRNDIFNLWDTKLLNVFLSTFTQILMSGCSCIIIVTMQWSIILYYIICYVTLLCYVILYYMLCYVMLLCYIILYYIILYYMLCCVSVVFYYIILYYIILYYIILYYISDKGLLE